MLTAEEIDAAGEEGVTETPPKLTQFKEQVDGFEAIYDEVESLKVFIYIYIRNIYVRDRCKTAGPF